MSDSAHLSVTSLRRPLPRIHVGSESPSAGRPANGATSLLVTLTRLPLALLGLVAITSQHAVVAVLCFSLFATIDVLDGDLARRLGQETSTRRLVDVLVDRVSIHAAVLTVTLTYHLAPLFFALLLTRDLAQGIYSGSVVWRYRTVVVAPRLHMSYGLGVLVWGICVLLFGSAPAVLSMVVLGVSTALLFDFVRRCRALVH